MARTKQVESETEPERCARGAAQGRVSLPQARRAAASCRACDLWRNATQTVFGAGPAGARLMLVGEQPGNEEDRKGQPFVGPAGRLLDRALAAAGIVRDDVYVTNVVKHFSWEQRGKWRIHKKPRPDQIRACRPWLLTEIELVQPTVIVCLGATAAQALVGATTRVTRDRGKPLKSDLAPTVFATVHPSSLLRAPDDETRRREFDRFVEDLQVAAKALRGPGEGRS